MILASQRIETAPGGLLWDVSHDEPLSRRGSMPSIVEWLILAWVSGENYLATSRSLGSARTCVHVRIRTDFNRCLVL